MKDLKFTSLLISLFVILGILSQSIVLAQISVGVKAGDWLEYGLSYSGSPPDFYPAWIRIDVTNVEGTRVTADLSGEQLDGTSVSNSGTYDLETGVIDLLLIPAGLDVGNRFYHKDYGNITITNAEENIYANSKRAVIFSTVQQVSMHWDKETGILVQADQSTDDFTQQIVIEKTNIWQSETFGIDFTILFVLTIAIVVILVILVIFIIKRKQDTKSS